MALNRINKTFRKLIFGLIPLLLFFSLDTRCLAQSDDPTVKNVKWSIGSEIIVLNYDLPGAAGLQYEIKVAMKKENDPLFTAIPVTVEGDFGRGIIAGENREIRWFFRRDYPQGFQGGGYYFEITAEPLNQGTSLLYYIAGGAAVTAGLIVLFSSKSQETTSPSELPLPPVRP